MLNGGGSQGLGERSLLRKDPSDSSLADGKWGTLVRSGSWPLGSERVSLTS